MRSPHIFPRRYFLGAAGAAFATVAAPIFGVTKAHLPDIAANAFGLRNHLVADFRGTLRALRLIGFKRIELVSFKGWDGHPYGSFTALAGLPGKGVASALSDAGLTARSSHVLPAELGADRLGRTLEWMSPIGVRTLIMAGLPVTGDADDLIRSIEDLNETGRRVAEQGYRLMLHSDFALWRPGGSGTGFDEFLRRVDPVLCKLQLDLGAVLQMSADAARIITDHSAHVGSLHLRDGKPPFDGKTYVPSLALGDGAAPIPKIMRAAMQAGISDYVLEMVMRPAGGEMAALARSLSYLRSHATGEMK